MTLQSTGFDPQDFTDPDELETDATGPSPEMRAIYEESLRDVIEGDIVKGTILEMREDVVLVDIGYKSEGLIPLREFRTPSGEITAKVGDTVDVYLEQREDSDGLIVLSREKAEKIKIWDELSQVYEKGGPISGMILGRTKGGLIVDIGVRAFLPGSQVDLRPVRDLDKLIGKAFPMKIIKLNQKRGNIVLSRRELLEEERKHLKEDTLATLAEGKRVKGKIKNITEYGAFVDLGGLDGSASHHRYVVGADRAPLGDLPGRRRDRGGGAQVRPDQRACVAGVQAAAARSLGGGGAAIPGWRPSSRGRSSA